MEEQSANPKMAFWRTSACHAILSLNFSQREAVAMLRTHALHARRNCCTNVLVLSTRSCVADASSNALSSLVDSTAQGAVAHFPSAAARRQAHREADTAEATFASARKRAAIRPAAKNWALLRSPRRKFPMSGSVLTCWTPIATAAQARQTA